MKKTICLFAFLLPLSALVSAQTFSLETGFLGTYSQVAEPETAIFLEEANSGSGNDIYFGLVVGLNDKYALRGGVRSWVWPFEPTTNTNDGGRVIEEGRIRYSGVYLRLDRTWQYFFLTGGFDGALTNSYAANLSIEDQNGQTTVRQTGNDTSVLTDEFNNQFNFVLGLGPSLPLGDKFLVRGIAEFVMPFVSVYESGEEDGFNFFPVFKYGIGLEYKLN